MDIPDQLVLGLAAGITVAAVVGTFALATRRRRGGPLPVAGAAGSVAALAAISFDRSIPISLVVGVVGVAVVCGLPMLRDSMPAMALLSAPFAWLVAVDASQTTWIRLAVVVTGSLGAIAVSVDPGRDVFFQQGPPDPLDPAAPLDRLQHKMAVDATAKLPGEHTGAWPAPAVAREEIRRLVADRWAEYGLGPEPE